MVNIILLVMGMFIEGIAIMIHHVSDLRPAGPARSHVDPRISVSSWC